MQHICYTYHGLFTSKSEKRDNPRSLHIQHEFYDLHLHCQTIR